MSEVGRTVGQRAAAIRSLAFFDTKTLSEH